MINPEIFNIDINVQIYQEMSKKPLVICIVEFGIKDFQTGGSEGLS